MKGIKFCGECGYYSYKLHKCTNGAIDEGYAKNPFYADCPLADVVEKVVYCKDCKYWIDKAGKMKNSDGVAFARCNIHNYSIDSQHIGWCPTENDFCSYGERKEDAVD